MNSLGIEAWKPLITALLLPPVPFLLLMLVGARLILPRRGLGWSIILLSVAGMWITTTMGFARVVERFVLNVPPALSSERIAEVRAEAKGKSTHANVELGGGVEPIAPE